MMWKCWNDDWSQRPTFDLLVQWLDDIIRSVRPGNRISSVLYQNVNANPSELPPAAAVHDCNAPQQPISDECGCQQGGASGVIRHPIGFCNILATTV